MRRFHEAPAAAVAASKVPPLLDPHRSAMTARRAHAPVHSRDIR
jgi:hypothetical protein